MTELFFERPILNSPYAYPMRHWELDASGQPTQKITETRRRAEFITPIPKSKNQKAKGTQQDLEFDEGLGLSTQEQRYNPLPIINDLRRQVDAWRALPNIADWRVTPETARLLQYWRHHNFSSIRPFFCQIEAVETAIWLAEVAPHIADVDGNMEDRRGAVSIFNGQEPEICIFDSEQNEISAISEWIKNLLHEGFQPQEIGIFVRSEGQLSRARQVAAQSGCKSVELNENTDTRSGSVAVSPMHLAKGLEFRAVAVMACDDEVIPLQERLESIADAADLEDAYNTERHLLYVACTRARDRLLITGIAPASEFLADLRG